VGEAIEALADQGLRQAIRQLVLLSPLAVGQRATLIDPCSEQRLVDREARRDAGAPGPLGEARVVRSDVLEQAVVVLLVLEPDERRDPLAAATARVAACQVQVLERGLGEARPPPLAP